MKLFLSSFQYNQEHLSPLQFDLLLDLRFQFFKLLDFFINNIFGIILFKDKISPDSSVGRAAD